MERLKLHLEAGRPYSDDLDNAFAEIQHSLGTTLQTSIYESLRARELELISDDELQFALIDLYENHNDALDRQNSYTGKVAFNRMQPYAMEHFELDGQRAKPLDYEALLGDRHFINLIESKVTAAETYKLPAYRTALAFGLVIQRSEVSRDMPFGRVMLEANYRAQAAAACPTVPSRISADNRSKPANVLPASLETFTYGSGQPLVLIHGSASDRRTWNWQIEAFGASFLVVSYSRRYHWPNVSIPENVDYAMAEHFEDLTKVLTSLDSSRAHLVGHSYGAYLALMVAIRRPELVDKLVLGEPPVLPLLTGFPPKPKKIFQQLIIRPRSALSALKFVVMGMVPAASAARRGHTDEAIAYMGRAILGRDAFNALSPTRLEQVYDNFMKAELIGNRYMMTLHDNDARRINAPTLLVIGEKSPVIWHRLADRLAELIPDTTRAEIPGSSHIMHEDNANAYNHAVLTFLES